MITKLKHPVISFSLVALQFSLIAVLLLVLPISLNLVVLLIQAFAIIIGLWAVQVMHIGNFNIVPDPKPDMQLITNGPYQWIRHPMYFSIVLFFFPLIVLNLNWINLSIYANLFIILFIKLSYEEHLLVEKMPEYTRYQQNTKRLIPFLL
jgi:protein-S-isoprenylcysteine O-methyltransferase Ste14